MSKASLFRNAKEKASYDNELLESRALSYVMSDSDLVHRVIAGSITDSFQRRSPYRAGMTEGQSNLLSYIKSFRKRNGFSPSYEQMKNHLGYASKSRIAALIDQLEERHQIVRLENRARSIVCCEEMSFT